MTSKLSPAWQRTLPGLLILLVGVLLLYRETGLAMVEIWDRSETFAHAFVVPPITLWLIWRQRALLAQQTPQPQAIFLLPMAGCALLWLVGDLAVVNAATQFAFTGMLVLAVPAALGWATARVIAFPLGFLFFAVPFGEFLMQPMMELTADFTVMALRASGIPVFREGLQFVIPSGNWSVVEACSGIRYLMASVMVGSLFAYLNYRSMKRRWIFVGVSIALPLLANWLRAYMIVMLGHFSGNKLATGADHLIYGWVFFGIIMLALFMIGARWAELDAPLPKATEQHLSPARSSTGIALLIAFAALLVTPMALRHALDRSGDAGALQLGTPDLQGQAWRLDTAAVPDFKPEFEHPAAELQLRLSKSGGGGVGLYIGYYRHQDYRSKLINSNNMLVRSNDKVWARVASGETRLALGGEEQALRTAELRASPNAGTTGTRRLSVRQVYWVNGHFTTRDWQAKLYGVLGRLTGQGDDAAVLVVHADKGEGNEGDALLNSFLQDNWTALDAWLRAARAAGR